MDNIINNNIFRDDESEENNSNDFDNHNNKIMNIPILQISENEELYSQLNNEGKYVNYINSGFSNIKNHKYKEGLFNFEEAYKIAESINDEFKKKESQCHIGIAKYMTGDLKGLDILEKLYYEYIEEMNKKNNDIDSINLILFSKIGSNLVLFYFIQNNLEHSIDIMNSMIDIIDKQKENNNKLYTIQNIIYILFRCSSLNLNKPMCINSNNNNNNLILFNEEYDKNLTIKKSIHNLFKEFNNYLKTNNLESFFKCISQTEEVFKKIEDYNGLIFILFLEQIILYYKEFNKEGKDMNDKSQEEIDSTVKIHTLIKTINQSNIFQNKLNENINNYIDDFNSKLETSTKMYELLFENEQKILELIEQENNKRNNINEDNNIKNKISEQESFQKILINILNQTISEIDNLQNNETKIQINSQIQETLSIIENKNIYFSKKVMEPFKNIINNTVKKRFNDNIAKIYNRIQKGIYFQLFQKKLEKVEKERIEIINNKKIKNYFEGSYIKIMDGNILLKLNVGNNGIKQHFYRVNFENKQIEVYNNNGATKPDKCLKLKQILKITFGFKSKNFISKLKNIPNSKEPWTGLSFICKLRSLDLIFKKEELAKNWFYGLQYILNNLNLSYKIISTSGYIIQKLKMKIYKKTKKNQKDLKNITFVKSILNYCNDNNIL